MSVESPTPGKLIIVEGIDGSGKSTQARMIAEMLEGEHYSVFLTREPGDGSLEAREAIFNLDHDAADAPYKELVFFEIDRTLHYQLISDMVRDGSTVISDRGPASSLAYQGYGRGVDLDFIRLANNIATLGRVADLTLLFDLDPDVAQKRLAGRNGENTRFDREKLAFHQALRMGFLREAALDPSRWVIIDATPPEDKVFKRVEKVIRRKFGILQNV